MFVFNFSKVKSVNFLLLLNFTVHLQLINSGVALTSE